MKPVVALQMDPLERLDPRFDSSLILAAEAARRGYELWHYAPETLSLREGALTALAAPMQLTENGPALGEPARRELAQAAFVLLRQDPPFDMAYVTSTHLLETLPASTRVLNDPFHVRNNPEKLFPLQFPQFIPPTLIASDLQEITDFRETHGDIVIKPLYGYGGHGVFLLRRGEVNAAALLELLLAKGEALVAQAFLPEVAQGERRVVMIGGEVKGVLARLPQSGEIRANLRVGGKGEKAELTPRQAEICAALGPVLREKNLWLAGLDFIGDWLIEINITSPTGLATLNALYGTSPERDFWDAAESL